MQEKISKALKTCAEAIRHALDEYNCCAEQLSPPQPPMTWTKLLEAVSLAELDIPHDSQQAIHDLKWAQPAHWEAMNLYFGIKGAKEEPHCLNVEIHQMLTFIIDNHVDHGHAIAATCMTDPHMAFQLPMEWQSCQKIHAQIMDCSTNSSFERFLVHCTGTHPKPMGMGLFHQLEAQFYTRCFEILG
jgi:hypothetical protein